MFSLSLAYVGLSLHALVNRNDGLKLIICVGDAFNLLFPLSGADPWPFWLWELFLRTYTHRFGCATTIYRYVRRAWTGSIITSIVIRTD